MTQRLDMLTCCLGDFCGKIAAVLTQARLPHHTVVALSQLVLQHSQKGGRVSGRRSAFTSRQFCQVQSRLLDDSDGDMAAAILQACPPHHDVVAVSPLMLQQSQTGSVSVIEERCACPAVRHASLS